jgi:hypothetical protein
MTDPKRYAPPEEDSNRTLQVDETVLMRDGSFAPQPASAILDTGNSAMTVIDESFALRHAIYVPPSAGSHSVFAEAVEWTTLRGINAGAETRAPVGAHGRPSLRSLSLERPILASDPTAHTSPRGARVRCAHCRWQCTRAWPFVVANSRSDAPSRRSRGTTCSSDSTSCGRSLPTATCWPERGESVVAVDGRGGTLRRL